MPEPRILLSGLGIPESPRWHEDRLWFCNWIDRQVVAVDMDGTAEVMLTRDPSSHPMGYSIDWLPDGRLLTTGDKIGRQEPDGSMAVHAAQRASEIVVDAHGNAYVNGADFAFVAGEPPSRATSSSSRRTGGYARSPTISSSPTAWSSPRTAGRWSSPSRSPAG